jgi:uncharacterized protein YerC
MSRNEIEALKEYRNYKSMELFDLDEYDLSIDELSLLDQYIEDLSNPIWKYIYINNDATNYMISNTGLIKNINTGNIIKSFPDKQKYLRITITFHGKIYTRKVHRLVAQAFIPNPENKLEVNHIYPKHFHTKMKCNWWRNLEWCTSEENIRHSIEYGLRRNIHGEEIGTSKYSEEQIRIVCKMLEDPYTDYVSINKKTNVSYASISKIASHTNWNYISKNYNIPNRINKRNTKYSDDQIRLVCNMLEREYRASDIYNETHVSLSTISSIKHHKRYLRISGEYKF